MRRISCGVVALVLFAQAQAGDPVPRSGAAPATDDDRVALSLLVQAALQQGRECLARGEYRSAVRALEAQLPKINGNAAYLLTLEQAYRGYVKDLREKGQEELAQRYLERLAILDPGVLLNMAVRPKNLPNDPMPVSAPVSRTDGVGPQDAPGAKKSAQPNELLAHGDREFQARHYYEAAGFYQQAFDIAPDLPQTVRERWAYCKLHAVTEQLNRPSAQGANLASLENEVRAALRLAPRLEYGKTLLKTLEERRAGNTSQARYSTEHHARKQEGWQLAESTNFRVFHQDAELAEKALQTAEHTRVQLLARWLGERSPPPWSVRCDIYLHVTAEAYCRATGVPGDSPGHSSIGAEREDAARIHSRRIDLHVDDPHLLGAVLPHETTHVVLAGQYGRRPLPRWADEGLAILTEPAERIQRHLRILPQALADGRVFEVGQLLELDDYPAQPYMHAFYGQSVALVQYLSAQKGPVPFTAFLRSAQREGYEAALRRHYGYRDYADLEQQWKNALLESQNQGTAEMEVRR